MAALADAHIPEGVPIDLLNVSFEKVTNGNSDDFDTPDRVSARKSLVELQQLCPKR